MDPAGQTANDSGHWRLPTRVPGLDTVLGGGLLAGDTCLITGRPGTGKTTLGNQVAFAHASQGGTVIFATLLTESHDRMLTHLRGLDFFDHALVGERIHYLSLLSALQDGDFEGVLRLLVETIRGRRADLLIIDGAGAARMFASSDLDFARFIQGVEARAGLIGCTTMLMNGEHEAEGAATHVDGVIRLFNDPVGARDARTLRVEKLRGSNHLNGRHQFAIGSGGITVFPRLEAAFADLAPGWRSSPDRFAIGIPGLDVMLSGGFQGGSCTLVLGPPGAGKTLLGLHFLAEGTRRGDRGIWAGFHETPVALAATADQAGLGLGPHLESGDVRVMWRPPLEQAPDEWAWQLIAQIEEHRPQRLVIDAFSDLVPLFVVPERRSFFAPALANTLRDREVTSMVLMEVDAIAGAAQAHNLSAIVDNGILLRTVERRSSLRRMVSVFKQRQTRFDETIREFTIGAQGIEVGGPFDAAETEPDDPSSSSIRR